MNRPPALLFGVAIADLTMDEALSLIDALAISGRANNTTYQISTVNVDFLVNALGDPDVMSILRGADVCLADGMPVVWGSSLLGMPIAERVAGSDLVPLLVEASQSTGHHVHIFGSSEEVADAARRLLRERYPRARFSIDPGPIIHDVEHVEESVLESIAAVDADILCVALGNPKQERFIQAHRRRLGTPVMIGVGGSLDMLVGKRLRAPRCLQVIGMEWIVRALQEPRRLGTRYLRDIRVFGPAFARTWFINRLGRGTQLFLHVDAEAVEATLVVDEPTASTEWAIAAAAVHDGRPLHVDFAGMKRVGDQQLAQIVGLVAIARRSGSSFRTSHLSDVLARDVRERGLHSI